MQNISKNFYSKYFIPKTEINLLDEQNQGLISMLDQVKTKKENYYLGLFYLGEIFPSIGEHKREVRIRFNEEHRSKRILDEEFWSNWNCFLGNIFESF